MTNLNIHPAAGVLNSNHDDFLEGLRKLVHMLSQPLTTLRGSAEVALMGHLDESEFRRFLELSLRESDRMVEVLEALRQTLDIEASRGDVPPAPGEQSPEKSH